MLEERILFLDNMLFFVFKVYLPGSTLLEADVIKVAHVHSCLWAVCAQGAQYLNYRLF